MKRILIVSFFMALGFCAFAQNTFKAVIKDSEKKEPLMGVTVQITGTAIATTSNENGQITLLDIPNGLQSIHFSYIGFNERIDNFQFPLTDISLVEILLYDKSEQLDEVCSSPTGSTRTIQHIPTRIELLGGEEFDENGNMKAGHIRMLISESRGIHLQTTSPTCPNQSIRLQGVDGRYTQS